MVHWIFVYALGSMTFVGPSIFSFDILPCMDIWNDFHRDLFLIGDIEESFSHLDDILAHTMKVTSFERSYLLREFSHFYQIKSIRWKMAVGYLKHGHNRNSSDKWHKYGSFSISHETLTFLPLMQNLWTCSFRALRRSFHMLRTMNF